MLNEKARRGINVVVAVTATVAAVFLYRWGVQAIVIASAPEASAVRFREGMEIEPLPKEFDLQKLVPEEIRLNVAGLKVERREEYIDMPCEVAEKVAEDRAIAAGWEPYETPMVYSYSLIVSGERVWKRPDGALVCRMCVPLKGSRTRVDDWELPPEFLRLPVEGADPLAERVRVSSMMVFNSLPDVIKPVIDGSLYFTQMIPRGDGAALIVATILTGSQTQCLKAIEKAARKNGWERDERGVVCWMKSNLAFSVCVQDRPPYGAYAVYRFTDDSNFKNKNTGEIINEN